MSDVEKGDGNKSDKTRVVRKNALTLYKEGVKHERKNQERLLSDIKIAIKQSYSDDLKILVAETVERTYATSNFTSNIDNVITKSFDSNTFKNAINAIIDSQNTEQTKNIVQKTTNGLGKDILIGVLSSFIFAIILAVVAFIAKYNGMDIGITINDKTTTEKTTPAKK